MSRVITRAVRVYRNGLCGHYRNAPEAVQGRSPGRSKGCSGLTDSTARNWDPVLREARAEGYIRNHHGRILHTCGTAMQKKHECHHDCAGPRSPRSSCCASLAHTMLGVGVTRLRGARRQAARRRAAPRPAKQRRRAALRVQRRGCRRTAERPLARPGVVHAARLVVLSCAAA